MSSERWSEQTTLFDLTQEESGIQVWLPEMGERFRGASWTASISESPSDAAESSRVLLSEILLRIGRDERYWLSAKAAQGILTRASRKGKSLPPSLQEALERAVSSQS